MDGVNKQPGKHFTASGPGWSYELWLETRDLEPDGDGWWRRKVCDPDYMGPGGGYPATCRRMTRQLTVARDADGETLYIQSHCVRCAGIRRDEAIQEIGTGARQDRHMESDLYKTLSTYKVTELRRGVRWAGIGFGGLSDVAKKWLIQRILDRDNGEKLLARLKEGVPAKMPKTRMAVVSSELKQDAVNGRDGNPRHHYILTLSCGHTKWAVPKYRGPTYSYGHGPNNIRPPSKTSECPKGCRP